MSDSLARPSRRYFGTHPPTQKEFDSGGAQIKRTLLTPDYGLGKHEIRKRRINIKAISLILAALMVAITATAVTGRIIRERITTAEIPIPITVPEQITNIPAEIQNAPAEIKDQPQYPTYPSVISPTVLNYPEKAVFIDGLIASRGYEVAGQTYLDIIPFLERINERVEITETKACVEIKGPHFEMKAVPGEQYIVTNGRYQYVPNGYMIATNDSGAGNTAGGSDSGSAGSNSGGRNNFYLPEDAVEKIFGVDVEKDGDLVNVSTTDAELIAGGEHYYDIHLDANTFYWLPHIINSETPNEALESKLAVANVVLNRVRFDLFPDTIYGVIYDTKYAVQFSPVAIGGVKGTPDELSYVAAFLAIEGYNNIDNCMYYVNPNTGRSGWFQNNLRYYASIGNHDFYFKPGDIIPDEPIKLS